MGAIKPYGDATGDGLVQMSFTLPMEAGERARQAALALVKQMGFDRAQVAHMDAMGPEFAFFVVYGATSHSVDPDLLDHLTALMAYANLRLGSAA